MSKRSNNLPKHVAIIMDGNGRWAKQRSRPRVFGHKQGVEAIKTITRHASHRGIQVLTVYAFSTENWSRPEAEVKYILKLPQLFFDETLPELMANNVQVRVIGDIPGLPEETHGLLNEAIEKTANNDGLILNTAINYGSRDEIVHAVQEIVASGVDASQVDEALIEKHLYTNFLGELSDPDLIIRTSGEERLSNFLLWQAAYSEFYFTDTLWPDFSPEDLDEALEDYAQRHRRYGKL